MRPRGCWQSDWRFRYLDLSLFASFNAGGRPAGDQFDPALPSGSVGKRDCSGGTASAAPDIDIPGCSSTGPDRSDCREIRTTPHAGDRQTFR